MYKNSLLENWHLMRWIRLSFGIIIAVQAIQTHDVLVGSISIFFLYQAVTNTGCCGANQCNMSTEKPTLSTKEDVMNFEEIKTK